MNYVDLRDYQSLVLRVVHTYRASCGYYRTRCAIRRT